MEDKQMAVFQDMRNTNTYSFISATGSFNNRFVLHFNQNFLPVELVSFTGEYNPDIKAAQLHWKP